MAKQKVSIYLNEYELELLFSAKSLYNISGLFIPFLPETKEVVQATIYQAFDAIVSNRNSLRAFVNSLLRKKNLPTIEQNDDESVEHYGKLVELEVEVKQNRPDGEYTAIDYTKNRTYIFPLEQEDEEHIEGIREYVENFSIESGYKMPELKDAEIVRECIHFTLGHKQRKKRFYYYTYIGSWYLLKPITSLRLFTYSDPEPEELVKVLDDNELRLVLKIAQDKDRFEEFKKKLYKYDYNYEDFNSFLQFERGSASTISNFNYQISFFGYWLIRDYLSEKIHEIPLMVALLLAHPLDYGDWKKMSKDLAEEVNFLIYVSQRLKDYVEKKF